MEHPLLGDPEIRRIIKAHAITFNVDDPAWQPGDSRRINDSKAYMPPMGMGFPIASPTDLLSIDFAAHLLAGRKCEAFAGQQRLSNTFIAYLVAHGVNPQDVASGTIQLRAKPLQGTFGCYGHVVGALSSGEFRSQLRRNMRQRGAYLIQPEMSTPQVINIADGSQYTYIDRNFFGFVRGHPIFLSGIRMFMPIDSTEAKRGRIHGNSMAVMGEVFAQV